MIVPSELTRSLPASLHLVARRHRDANSMIGLPSKESHMSSASRAPHIAALSGTAVPAEPASAAGFPLNGGDLDLPRRDAAVHESFQRISSTPSSSFDVEYQHRR
jgi:hypothetical protein